MKHTQNVSNLPVVQSLWIGKSLSVMEQMCLSSFLDHGCAVHLYVYDAVAGVPAGVDIKDAAEIVPAEKIFKYRDHDSYAGFANLFRYRLLFQKGHYWTDTDIVCLKPLAHEHGHLFASQRMQPSAQAAALVAAAQDDTFWRRLRRRAGMVKKPRLYEPNNCLMRAPAGSPVMAYCYNEAARKNPQDLQWGETGPLLLKTAVERFDMWRCVAKPEVFCPIDWWNHRQAVEGLLDERLLAASSAVHLWNEKWRRDGIDKEGAFPADCLYERMKKVVGTETRGIKFP